MTRSAAVAMEGANGTGKTYLARRAAAALGDRCHLLPELSESPAGTLAGQVIAALRDGGGQFLQSGTPRTETLLLAALQVHRHESLPALRPGRWCWRTAGRSASPSTRPSSFIPATRTLLWQQRNGSWR